MCGGGLVVDAIVAGLGGSGGGTNAAASSLENLRSVTRLLGLMVTVTLDIVGPGFGPESSWVEWSFGVWTCLPFESLVCES